MEIAELEQEIESFEWFGIDEEGAIASFDSGGRGKMPRSVTSSLEDLQTVTEFFKSQTSVTSGSVIHPSIDRYLTFPNSEAREGYICGCSDISRRGIYCYECIVTGPRPTGYFRASRPTIPMRVSTLPTDIQSLLERTRLKGVLFSKSDVIGLESLA